MKPLVWTERGRPGRRVGRKPGVGWGVRGGPCTYIPCWEMRWARGYREMGHREPRWLRADSGVEIIRHVSFTPHNPFPTRDLRTDHFDEARLPLSTTYR